MNLVETARKVTIREELRVGKTAVLLILWFVLAFAFLAVFAVDLWVSSGLLAAPCAGPNCHYQAISEAEARTLAGWGLPVTAYTVYMLGASVVPVVLFSALAMIMLARLYPQGQGFLYSLMLIVIPVIAITSFDVVAAAFPVLNVPLQLLVAGGMLLLMSFFLVFPRDRFEPGWTFMIPVAAAILMVANLFYDALTNSSPYYHPITFLLLLVSAIIVYRYRRLFSPAERQQTRWVLLGMFIFFVGVPIWSYTFEVSNPAPGQARLLTVMGGWTLSILASLALPIAIFIAILRYRLWDIAVIINRTLVYGGLSFGIVATYVLVVGTLGALFHSQGSFLFTLLATGLIAILFQPVRERLQKIANRLMFGEWDEPYAVLSRLGQRLQTTDTPEAMLQSVVETIAAALRLPYLAIELADEQGQLGGAATGKAVADTVDLPLRYQNEMVGYLVISPRSPGEAFSEREQQLLAAMAAQMGAMAHSVRLTAALQRTATALQQSREKLVLTREEERRRIRRDLHDGLGPTLASQTFAFDAILELLQSNPQEAARLLRGLKAQNQETVAEIRRLVYELRPPALDELGFIGALQAHVAQLNGRSTLAVRITVQPDPLPPLSAAVEVAAYRIALEAITNVVRHAQAQRCIVQVRVLEGAVPHLQVDITDNGIGLPAGPQPGMGTHSMRERAEELGGSLVVASLARGTRVTAVLPL